MFAGIPVTLVVHRAPGSLLGRGTGDCARYGAFSSGQQPRRACHDIKAGLHPPPRAMREEGANEDDDQDKDEGSVALIARKKV